MSKGSISLDLIRRTPVWVVYCFGFLPAAVLVYQASANLLGPDPVKVIEHELGLYSLKFLIAAMVITPVHKHLQINLMKFRRALGLLCFWYAAIHFLTYIVLDQQFYWNSIAKDLAKRPYIMFGFTSFLILMVLAVSSNNYSIRRLGTSVWKKLHLLVYPAALMAALHFIMLVKSWPLEPLIYCAIISGLIFYKVVDTIRRKLRTGQIFKL